VYRFRGRPRNSMMVIEQRNDNDVAIILQKVPELKSMYTAYFKNIKTNIQK
jgi:hypothetical protein